MAWTVRHVRHGSGKVLKTRYGGFELLVRFSSGLECWVRLNDVTESQASDAIAYQEPAAAPAGGNPTFVVRRMVEAFRLGIVPFDCLDGFTFGRDAELHRIAQWLSDPASGVLVLTGEYGSGKTHLLHHLYAQALQGGFAVSMVQMDPGEAPFHKPKRVYGQIVKTLRFRDRATGSLEGFRVMVRRLFAAGVLADHPFFRQVMRTDQDELVWEWIEAGHQQPRPSQWTFNSYGQTINYYWSLPGLYDYATAANVYCNLLSALSWAGRKVLNLKGLLILFDESESLAITDTSYQWEKGYNFLRALIRLAGNDPVLVGHPAETGLVYCNVGRASATSFAFRQPSHLKLMFALTPDFPNFPVGGGSGKDWLVLEQLQDSILSQVFEQIVGLYCKAFSVRASSTPSSNVLRRLLKRCGSTRRFVKGTVEALDLARFRQGDRKRDAS